MTSVPPVSIPQYSSVQRALPAPAATIVAPTASARQPAFVPPSAPVSQAREGSKILFDFPGMGAGDVFKLGKGSKIAIAGIKGDAFIEAMTPTSAQFRIRGKAAFFLNVDARVNINLMDNDVVRLHAAGKGVPELTANGRVSEQRTNLLRVAPLELRVRDTSIERTNDNTILIDFEHPTLGVAHLVLERQIAAQKEAA